MKSFNRSAIFVLLVALVLWSLAVAFLWLHLISPSDNARLPPGDQSAWLPNGVVVAPIEEKPDGLRAGDIVTAIDGQSLESYARILFDPSAPRPSWRIGQIVQYTILRDSNAITLPITLGNYPLVSILRHDWGAILFGLVSQLITLFVFLHRPNDSAAQTLFLWAAGILSATTWSLGLQVGDLVSGIGFWLLSPQRSGRTSFFG